MAGYIIELYKNIISDGDYWGEQGYKDASLKGKAFITYGAFDKMAISRTNAFSRMRDMSKLSRSWIGDRQTILLYELSEENRVIYNDMGEEPGIYVIPDDGGSMRRSDSLFIGITVLQFRNNPQDTEVDVKELLENCRKNILHIVKEQGDSSTNVDCSVFGVLGSYGVAVLWVSDQFVEILRLINFIKGKDICAAVTDSIPENSVLLSAFTIFAKNILPNEIVNAKLPSVKGKAILQVTLQTNLNDSIIDELEQKIPGIESFHSAGEHDLLLFTDAKNLYNRFEKKEIFDPQNHFYRDHILQTNLELCETITKDGLTDILPLSLEREEKKGANWYDENLQKKVEESYDLLRRRFFEYFPKTAGMVDSLDLLYGDYLSKIATVSNIMWAEDFAHHFLAILNVLNKNLEIVVTGETAISTVDVLKDFREILNGFEYQIVHIAESNNLVLDTPKCHLRYTGQNNLTLYAYFGIVKDIIELIYSMQRMCKQSQLIPLILVDTVPIIQSVLFSDYGEPDEDRVLIISLPMMALYSIPAYSPYLFHELYHYAVPEDRAIRNWKKGSCLVTMGIANVIKWLLYSKTQGLAMKDVVGIVSHILLPYIYSIVTVCYHDEIMEEIQSRDITGLTKEQANKKIPSWGIYEENLIQDLKSLVSDTKDAVLEDNLVYLALRNLFYEKEAIKRRAEQWMSYEASFDSGDKEKIKHEMSSFMDSLVGLVENIDGKNKTEVFRGLIHSTQLPPEDLIDLEELIDVSVALSEVLCDIPMVELAGMDVTIYLLSYVKIRKDILKKGDCEVQMQDFIRVGIVIDYFLGFHVSANENRKKIEAVREDFVNSYIGLYYSEHRAGKQSSLKTYLEVLADEAGKWFDDLKIWYKQYAATYRIYSSLFQSILMESEIKKRIGENKREIRNRFSGLKTVEYYYAVKAYGYGLRSIIANNHLYSEKCKRDEIKIIHDDFQKQVFEMNIYAIQKYQKQKRFGELNQMCDDLYDKNAPYGFDKKKIKSPENIFADPVRVNLERRGNEKIYYRYTVDGIESLCGIISTISETFSKQDRHVYKNKNLNHNLWYRGHQKEEYKLLPTAMRRYKTVSNTYKSLFFYQRKAYEEFKFRADTSSDHIDKTGFTDCDYLALMQHYGAPTIYMDWSESAIQALYFALEAYIDPKKANEQNDKNAILYILHPNLYNKARNEIMKISFEEGTDRKLDELMEKTIQENTDRLPNLSVDYNKDTYAMFLLGRNEDESSIKKPKLKRIDTLYDEEEKERLLYLPLAIYSSRANARIRAQFGMFTAFNIYTQPRMNQDFDYMAFEAIQEFYLDYFKDARPFMYCVVIKNDSKKKIADWLKAMGVSKEMIYPELSNIGERI